MSRTLRILLLLVPLLAPAGARAAETIVLPFENKGLEEHDAAVARTLLEQELRILGARVRPVTAEPCGEPACAAAVGRESGADRVVYGSLTRLGGKILVHAYAVRVSDGAVVYSDRLSATVVEELDTVMLRVAEGVASGRADSDRPTLDSVLLHETADPARRATRHGLGVRGGFLYPMGDSYGGADRLTSLSLVYAFQGRDFLVETTTILGSAWGEGAREWIPLDIFAARVFGKSDFNAFVGAGFGLRHVTIERRERVEDTSSYQYWDYYEESATTLSMDLGVGLFALRTYDVNLVVQLRYHYVFESFDAMGGDGAHGLALSFGFGR